MAEIDEDGFDDLLADDQPLDQLWRDLRGRLHHAHQRPVLAYKILAGKRPRLLPVFDSQVAALLRDPGDGRWWRPMWEAVRREGVQKQLMNLRDEVGVPERVSALRVLDVIAWMEAERLRV